jgi:hypothetical protein
MPQAPVLSPERVQLSSRDQNHVFGVRGYRELLTITRGIHR